MARIRTIKPEFPQSETIGKLSRDARLLFIQIWTLADDDGRARAASRMLASLLYPYDDDAPGLIGNWLEELEQNSCIRRYEVDGSHYLEVLNWLKHQKIDHKSISKLPPFSRALASPREPSRSLAPDLGPRIGKEVSKSSEAKASAAVAAPAIEKPPDVRTALFHDGLASLREITGKTDSGCRQLLGHWLKDSSDDAGNVLRAIQSAKSDRVADPVAWITAALKPRPPNWRDRPELRGVL